MTANESSGRRQRDTTTRDDALRRAVRLTVVQELADEVAHEFNNVLTVITGNLQLFLLQQDSGTAAYQALRNAVDAAQRGAQMTGNLLAYASPQVVDVQAFDLVAVVQGMAPLLRETLAAPDALEIVLPTDTTTDHRVVADRRFIESALLAIGAITAAQPAGSVHMRLRFKRLSGGDAAHLSGVVSPETDVVQLTVECEASGLSGDLIRQALTPAFGTVPSGRPVLDLSAAYAAVRQCDGDMAVAALDPPSRDGFVITILLPKR